MAHVYALEFSYVHEFYGALSSSLCAISISRNTKATCFKICVYPSNSGFCCLSSSSLVVQWIKLCLSVQKYLSRGREFLFFFFCAHLRVWVWAMKIRESVTETKENWKQFRCFYAHHCQDCQQILYLYKRLVFIINFCRVVVKYFKNCFHSKAECLCVSRLCLCVYIGISNRQKDRTINVMWWLNDLTFYSRKHVMWIIIITYIKHMVIYLHIRYKYVISSVQFSLRSKL